MKRVISASIEPFKMTTDTSYYDNFLNAKDLKYMQDAKNRTGRIEYMTPEEYYDACAERIFDISKYTLKMQRSGNPKLISKYKQDFKNGDKFPLPFLNYADQTQEGLHRMMALGDAFGWNVEVPVLCIYVFDTEVERRCIRLRKLRDFESYELEKICETAAYQISDWYEPVPDNVTELYAHEVESVAKAEGHNIEVEVELREIEGHLKLCCYLMKYEGEPVEMSSDSARRAWLEDMFNCDDDDSDLEWDELLEFE